MTLHWNIAELEDTLRKFAGDLFPGLTVQSANLLEPGLGLDDQTQAFIGWVVIGLHGEQFATPDSKDATFLGFKPTGRTLTIPIVSIATPKSDGLAEGLRGEDLMMQLPGSNLWLRKRLCFWDQLSVLGQMGVRAVGRPVV